MPAWIDRMAYRPGEFIRVSAAAEESFAFPGQAVAVTISVTNQSDVPLGLGPDRPISSRIALMSKLSRGVPEDRIRPEIIDAEQRLRLMPRETLKVTVWPGVGQSGWALDAIGNRNVTVRWRVIHGFVMDNSGTVLPGALGTAVETDSVLFRPLPDSMCTGDELAKRIAAAPLSTLTRHMLLARASVLQPLLVPDPVRFKPIERIGAAPVSLPAEVMDGKPVAQAFAARYASLPRELRALIAVIVPHARLASDYAAVDAVVRADQDPLIRCIALCTRVIDPQDELLRSGSTSDDLRVRAVAAAVSAHLTTPAALYARMSPDSFPKPDAKKPAPPK